MVIFAVGKEDDNPKHCHCKFESKKDAEKAIKDYYNFHEIEENSKAIIHHLKIMTESMKSKVFNSKKLKDLILKSISISLP